MSFVKIQRLATRSSMTIAIGTPLIGGAILCADSRVVASDGATTTDGKLLLSAASNKTLFAIADAAHDGRAAKMLSKDILDAARKNPYAPVQEITKVMKPWFNSYENSGAPSTQFILASVIDDGWSKLYFCEPPATVLEIDEPIAIGFGSVLSNLFSRA